MTKAEKLWLKQMRAWFKQTKHCIKTCDLNIQQATRRIDYARKTIALEKEEKRHKISQLKNAERDYNSLLRLNKKPKKKK